MILLRSQIPTTISESVAESVRNVSFALLSFTRVYFSNRAAKEMRRHQRYVSSGYHLFLAIAKGSKGFPTTVELWWYSLVVVKVFKGFSGVKHQWKLVEVSKKR